MKDNSEITRCVEREGSYTQMESTILGSFRMIKHMVKEHSKIFKVEDMKANG